MEPRYLQSLSEAWGNLIYPLERPRRGRDNLEPEGTVGAKEVWVWASKTLWAWIIREKLNNDTRTKVSEHLVGVDGKHSERVEMDSSG